MSALTGLISLISNFIDLMVSGVQSIFNFGKIAINYLQLFLGFIPVQFTALFMIVIVAALIYLIVGR